jgi:hypothetical protein
MAATDAAPGSSPGDTARYIERMAGELRRLAAASDLGFLAYLLRMVEDDAGAEAKKRGAGDSNL